MEIAIFPTAMTSAMIRLLSIMTPTGAPPDWAMPAFSTVE